LSAVPQYTVRAASSKEMSRVYRTQKEAMKAAENFVVAELFLQKVRGGYMLVFRGPSVLVEEVR
jgi:hypothetical protein